MTPIIQLLNPVQMAYCWFMTTKSKTQPAKRGRPAGEKTKRISPRFPERLVEKIEYAAALRGLTVSAFVQEAVAERAERVIDAESRWELTRVESATIRELIENPPEPGKKLIEAVQGAAKNVVIRS